MMSRIIKMDALTDFNAMCIAIAEARHAMRLAVEAGDIPEIERIFIQTNDIHAEVAGLETYFEEGKDAAAEHQAREARLHVELLQGECLIETEKKGLRFMGRPSKGVKIGAPPPSHLLSLEKLGITKEQSIERQAIANLSPAEFEALVASDRATSTAVRPGRKISVLPLPAIRLDERAQPRVSVNWDRVAEYAEEMKRGAKFPPIVVFEDSDGVCWPGDGFHRYYAAEQAKLETIKCEVRKGGLREAILYACGANATHGLRRTNEDKRAAVLKLLKDDEWSHWSNSEIGRRCNVSDHLVGRLRQELTPVVTSNSRSEPETPSPPVTGNIPTQPPSPSQKRVYRTKHGTSATMNTGNIGRAKSKKTSSAKSMLSGQAPPLPPEAPAEPALPELQSVPGPDPAPAPASASAAAPKQLDLIRDTTPAVVNPTADAARDRVACARVQIGSMPETPDVTALLFEELARRTAPHSEIMALAVSVRRRTRDPEVISLCDWVIAHSPAIGRVPLADYEGADFRGEVEQMPPLPTEGMAVPLCQPST